MGNKELTKPVYKRQQFLLAFLQEIKGGCSATDLQKLLFLYSQDNDVSFYNFVPYRYGSYSFQLAQDVDTLQSMGWLEHTTTNISYIGYASSPLFNYSASRFKSIDSLRGNKLIKKVYTCFFLGTTKANQLRAPNPFIIIGVFYPPRSDTKNDAPDLFGGEL